MTPNTTVIIPTYNWSTVLPFAIQSVLAQTVSDFELLVVGDGCTDDLENVVRSIEDGRVRWINLPAHTGQQAGPNNRGLQEARGKFVAYLGHDDLWLPHHLACMTRALEAGGGDIAYSLVTNIPPYDGEVGVPSIPWPEQGLLAPPSCIVHRRGVTQTIGGWGDYREMAVDPEQDLWRRAHAAGFTSVFVPRLTVVKFPASRRKDAYRKRPCHEQAAWLQRIQAEPDLEAEQLARIIATGEAVRALPLRMLLPLVVQVLVARIRLRLSYGLAATFWPFKGARIRAMRKFKGISPNRRGEY